MSCVIALDLMIYSRSFGHVSTRVAVTYIPLHHYKKDLSGNK
jgi:hypothetical protein